MAKHRLSTRSSEQNTRTNTGSPAGKSPQTAIAPSPAAGRSARLAFSPFMRDALSFSKSKRPLLTPDEVRAIYGPAKTLGAPKEVQVAMDSALEQAGFYSLLQHGMDMGVYSGMANFMGYAALQNIAQNGLIRACIETVSDDMTRNWIEVTRDSEKEDADKNGVDDVLDKLNKEMDRLELQKVFHEACSLVGYYGGCLLYLDTGTSEDLLKNPLNLDPMFSMEARNRGFLKAVRCVDPINIFPGIYNATDPLANDYYRPSTWWVQGREVHATRLLRIVANEAPLIFKPNYNFLGIPQAQILWDYVLHFQKNRDAANRLLNKFSMLVFKTSMADLITNEGGLDQLDSRMMLLARNQSNDGVFAIDRDNEDVVKIETPLGGVTDIVKQSLEQLAAMNRTPAVKLLGISPSGFNSTGDSDIRNYYDHVLSQQEKVLRHAIKDILDVIQISLFGEVDDSIGFTFKPLSEDDKNAVAMTQQVKANTLCALLDRDIISPEEARRVLIADPSSGLNDLDPEDVPEPKDEQGMGGMPGMPGMPGGGEAPEQTPEGQVAEESDEVSLGRKLLGMDAEPEGEVDFRSFPNGKPYPIKEGQTIAEAAKNNIRKMQISSIKKKLSEFGFEPDGRGFRVPGEQYHISNIEDQIDAIQDIFSKEQMEENISSFKKEAELAGMHTPEGKLAYIREQIYRTAFQEKFGEAPDVEKGAERVKEKEYEQASIENAQYEARRAEENRIAEVNDIVANIKNEPFTVTSHSTFDMDNAIPPSDKSHSAIAMALSKREEKALRDYSGPEFDIINKRLQSGQLHPKAKIIDDAFAECETTAPLILFRGERSAPLDQKRKYKNYVSSTSDFETARKYAGGENGGAIYEIHLPEGSHAISMKGISQKPEEKEILLSRGTRFRKVGTRTIGGQEVIIVEAFTPRVEKRKLSKKEYAATMSEINKLYHSQLANRVGEVCSVNTGTGRITFRNNGFNDYEIMRVSRYDDIGNAWEE